MQVMGVEGPDDLHHCIFAAEGLEAESSSRMKIRRRGRRRECNPIRVSLGLVRNHRARRRWVSEMQPKGLIHRQQKTGAQTHKKTSVVNRTSTEPITEAVCHQGEAARLQPVTWC
jgi:hypothetical protein